MTREQKIEWLANATDEQVVEQIRWAVTAMTVGNLSSRIEANEDYELTKAELMKRLASQQKGV